MTAPWVPGGAAIKTPKTASHRIVFKGGVQEYLPGGKLIAGLYSRDPGNTGNVNVLRAGLLMGKRTSGGLYAPSIIGVTANAEAVGATTIESSAAIATEIIRRIGATGTFKLIGPATAGGAIQTATITYSAANTSTGDITVTAIANNFIAGSFICPTDGSEDPLTVIADDWGIQVTENDGSTNLNAPFDVPVRGQLVSSQIINWPSDASLRGHIVTALNRASGGKFTFDHTY